MRFSLYTADCCGNAANRFYPHKVTVEDRETLAEAVSRDQVFAKYRDGMRSTANFLFSDVIPLDCDNDHSENPADWLDAGALEDIFRDVDHAIFPSRHHMQQKNGKAARPRYHLLFPVSEYADAERYAAVKNAIGDRYDFIDSNALDAARFFYGSEVGPEDIVWHEGFLQIDETLDDAPCTFPREPVPMYTGGSIREGVRNNTMSHFAGRVLKKYGDTEKAKALFYERSERCDPPLSHEELGNIWKSAIRFYERISSEEGYISPETYNAAFEENSLEPEDRSDIGEAKVLARENCGCLKYTSATDFLTFCGDRWHEDRQRALGVAENFMDLQLSDAEDAVRAAEQALIAAGVPETEVKSRSRSLEKFVPIERSGLLKALKHVDGYKAFVMKYRNYRNIVNVQNAAKPMLAIDVSELDYDPELLNTPSLTFDLSKGMDGGRAHDPEDLITKVTACSPGTQGEELWRDTLDLFFCGDKGLIRYVKEIAGMAAVGKVYAEHMIIAYGGGANGKSTFWNTIARVLGSYSGKISAEALTMSCRRNVKPEMAELKGKRLIIASELEEGTRLNTGMVKQLCSVDPIEAEKKYKDPFHFDPSHTLVLYTNHLPRVSATDEGTWRRLIVIPFNAKITGRADIKNYSDYLFENAGPAILAWIIEGAKEAIAKGFRLEPPPVVEEAIRAYREENDWLGQFIEEHCDVDPSYSEASGTLYTQYRTACMATGEFIHSTSDFYGGLEKAGYPRRRMNTGRVVVGLRLKDGQDFLPEA